MSRRAFLPTLRFRGLRAQTGEKHGKTCLGNKGEILHENLNARQDRFPTAQAHEKQGLRMKRGEELDSEV